MQPAIAAAEHLVADVDAGHIGADLLRDTREVGAPLALLRPPQPAEHGAGEEGGAAHRVPVGGIDARRAHPDEHALDDYPDLSRHVEQHLAQGPHQDVSAFELGLDLILEGLRKVRAR